MRRSNIDEHFVITAAHCVLNPVGERGTIRTTGVSIVVGSTHSKEEMHSKEEKINTEHKQKIKVEKIIPYHENYYETDTTWRCFTSRIDCLFPTLQTNLSIK